jgi:hypothetical protein
MQKFSPVGLEIFVGRTLYEVDKNAYRILVEKPLENVN